jgi:hypothetical protein
MKRPKKITIGETASAKPRRFMRPWSVTERDGTYEVRDAAGLNLATIHFEDQPDRQSHLNRLSKDEARRVAGQIARRATCPHLPNRDRPSATWISSSARDRPKLTIAGAKAASRTKANR